MINNDNSFQNNVINTCKLFKTYYYFSLEKEGIPLHNFDTKNENLFYLNVKHETWHEIDRIDNHLC